MVRTHGASGASSASILVVDDDAGITSLLTEVLVDAGYDAVGVLNAADAELAVRHRHFDLMITDLVLPDMRGNELLQRLRKQRPSLPVIVITAFGSMDLAMQVLRQGASDFIAKPFTPDQLLLAVQRVLLQSRLEREEEREHLSLPTSDEFLSEPPPLSSAMQAVERLARRAASTEAHMLITGESGTGKTRIAKQIHEHSERAAGPFVVLNCGAIPSALVESELFGVVKGAFTDAKQDRAGLVQSAHGGTLFLDEIADLPAEAQAKLLRVLERKVVRPVGAVSESPVDIRVLSATHQSLENAVAAGTFRADLYYRLHVIKVHLPSLRERVEDIPALAAQLLTELDSKRRLDGFDEEALQWLQNWRWPGNIRELSNRLQRAVALAPGPRIRRDDVRVDDLELGPAGPVAGQQASMLTSQLAADGLPADWEPRPLLDVEREHIARTLRFTAGNKAQAAELLGIDRRTLYRRLEDEKNE